MMTKAMRSAEPWFISYFAKLGKLDGARTATDIDGTLYTDL